LRLDIAEKVAGELGYRSRHRPAALPSGLASRFAIKPDMLSAVLRQLGFRVLPAATLAADQQGPPAPPMLMAYRRRRPLPAEQPAALPTAGGPFAALASLRHGGAR
jgi:ATP-dependent RNA helicase SUPV3L1/SUV3